METNTPINSQLARSIDRKTRNEILKNSDIIATYIFFFHFYSVIFF